MLLLSTDQKELKNFDTVVHLFDDLPSQLIAAVIHELGHVFQERIKELYSIEEVALKKLKNSIEKIPTTTAYSEFQDTQTKQIPAKIYERWCEGITCEAMRLPKLPSNLCESLNEAEFEYGKCLEVIKAQSEQKKQFLVEFTGLNKQFA